MQINLRTVVPALAVVCCLAFVSSNAWAQRGGPQRGGFTAGGAGMMGLLMNEQIREELELVDGQMQQLRELGEEMRQEMRSAFEGIRELPEDERRERFAEMREKMEGMREKMEDKMSDVLLPHQIDRLKQIRTQMTVRRAGVAGALESGALAEQLDLSEEQQEKLAKRAAEVREDLQKKIAEMREKAEDEVLSVLTPAQREKYKELVGEPFELDNSRFGAARRGQGDQDGRRRDGDRRRGDRDED